MAHVEKEVRSERPADTMPTTDIRPVGNEKKVTVRKVPDKSDDDCIGPAGFTGGECRLVGTGDTETVDGSKNEHADSLGIWAIETIFPLGHSVLGDSIWASLPACHKTILICLACRELRRRGLLPSHHHRARGDERILESRTWFGMAPRTVYEYFQIARNILDIIVRISETGLDRKKVLIELARHGKNAAAIVDSLLGDSSLETGQDVIAAIRVLSSTEAKPPRSGGFLGRLGKFLSGNGKAS